MNVIKNAKIYFLIFAILSAFTQSKAEIKIAFVEMDTLINESLVGKSMIQQLDKLNKENVKKFSDKRKKLSSEKDKIQSQKNILSKEEFEKKVINLNSEFEKVQKDANSKGNDLRTKKNNAMKKIMEELNEVLSEYSKKNNLAFIIDQNNIVIGRTDLNITKDIIKLLDQKIQKIKLN
tara:strand:+ start:14493 stop:15026 length:534 start_codon:yes stop_codon:yes gene_type:complete